MLAALLIAAGTARAAAAGAALVPASAETALVLDGKSGASGLLSLLATAGSHAYSLSPDAVSASLRARVGVDLLAEQPAFGLAAAGPRVLVLSRRGAALSAPVGNEKAARKALLAWLAEKGPSRRSRAKPLQGALAAGDRAAQIAFGRLLLASGRDAIAQISTLSHLGQKKGGAPTLAKDGTLKAALLRARGPAWVWLRLPDPLRGAVLALDGSAKGLSARGVVIPAREALLAGLAPAACAPSPGCLRAGLGATGRALLGRVLRELAHGLRWGPELDKPLQRAAADTGRFALRLDGLDPHQLAGADDWLRSLRFALALDAPVEPAAPFCNQSRPGALLLGSPSCPPAPSLEAAPGPALQGSLDLAALDRGLSRLTPLDVLHGNVAAGAYAAHLIYGGLLRAAGPLTCVGSPAKDVPGGAELEFRLPLR